MLSICEDEYVAASSAVCHGIGLRNVLKYLGFPLDNPTEVHIDNQSVITLAKNLVNHEIKKQTHRYIVSLYKRAREKQRS